MSAPANDTRKLKCPGCGGQFRIRSREGRPLPSAVPCPTCETRIPVERPAKERFWVSQSYADIFHRNPALAAPLEGEEEASEADATSGGDREPADEPTEGPGVRRTERSFRDVSEIGKQGSVLGREESSEPIEEYEREAPEADLAEADGDLEFTAASEADDPSTSPLPLPVEQPSGVGIGDAESSEVEPAEVEGADEAAEPEDTGAEPDDEPIPAADLATMPFTDWEGELADEDIEGEASFDIRRDGEVEEGVGIRQIVAILKTGVESASVDVRDGESWTPLHEHPVVDKLHDYIAGLSGRIRLSEVDEASAGPPPHPEADEPAEPAEEPEPESEDDEEPPPIAEPPPRTGLTRTTTWAMGAVLLALLAVLAVWYARQIGAEEGVSDGAVGAAAPVDAGDAGRVDGESSEADTSDGGPEALVFEEATDTGSPVAGAVEAARQAVWEGRAPRRRAESYLEAEAWEPARRLAIRLMAEEGRGGELEKIYRKSIENDPSLYPETVTIGVDESVGKIHALGGGWSISFRMTKGGRSAYAFKPSQERWKEGWRAEIAAYRLCEIIACHFYVPRNRPARVSKETFDKLYGRVEGDYQTEYREERFDDLNWQTETGPDGEERKYLYGTLKDWVPEFVKWPIEYESVWRPWLSPERDADILQKPFTESLAPLKEKGEEDFYENILSERGGVTTRGMARQLSSLLVFDFLISNWDRFSTAEKFYGVNNQFADGRFISLDNGAGFPQYHFDIVARRLEPVGRFSRRTVVSIRALDPMFVNPVLFPSPSLGERGRLGTFWDQRRAFLDLINQLRAEYGNEAVFAFR